MRYTLAAVALVVVAVAHADPKKDLTAMAGKWQPSSMKIGKAETPAESLKKIQMVIDGDKYTVTVAGEGTDKGTLKLGDPTKDTPKPLDITSTEGPNKGKTFPCIFEIDGDTLKVCYSLDGKTRPKEFKAGDDKTMLAVYKKMK